MKAVKLLARIAAVLLLINTAAKAQTLTEPQEWGERIKTAEAIAPLGTDLFGDSTNYGNGQVSFTATDIDLPGNDALPVRLTRTLGPKPDTSDNAQRLGNWDLELPYMSGVYAAGRGWQNSSGTFARCTGGLIAPDVVSSTMLFLGSSYWRTISMKVPGKGSQTVLNPSVTNNQRPTDGQTTRFVTSGFWQIRCLPQIANPSSEAGFSGEAFEALAPDGTRYRFDWMTRQYFAPLKRAYGAYAYTLPREEIRLYATRVQDHHGNWVQYSYSGGRPTAITASDGRSITLSYDGAGHLRTATANGRNWQYAYTAESSTATLTGVTLPDGSAWSMSGALPKRVIYKAGINVPTPPCGYPGTVYEYQNTTLTMTHPSGATGQFTLAPVRRGRNATDRGACIDDTPDPNFRHVVPKVSDNFGLVSKTISGPGIATPYVWNLSYSNVDLTQPTQWTQVTEPDGTRSKYTFGTRWNVDEGKLLRSETQDAGGNVLRAEATTYATGAARGPYPYEAGSSGGDADDNFAETHLVPSYRTVITQAGDTYVTAVNSFDEFARSLSVTESNSLGANRTDITAYHNDKNHWVMGQVRSITNSDTGRVASAAAYGASSVKPESLSAFGLLKATASYNSDGTLRTLSDGLNRTTTYASWKRGIPQSISYPDSQSASAVVNDSSWITAITDPRGATTNYGYDSLGRILGLSYPTGDTMSWSGKATGYTKLSASELGVPAGSWRVRVNHGRRQTSTYYDALLRPILVEDHDNLFGVTNYTRKAYDHDGRAVFESYPSTSSNSTSGIVTTYDALGRVTRTDTTDDVTLSMLSMTSYLSGNRQQRTDADYRGTTISYQAFGSPDDKAATLIQSAEGQTTTIARDVFGKITSITQSGLYSGSTLSATRSFSYDSHQRPCRRFDPESGSTVWGYDAANQVIWEAKGQSGSGCLSTAPGDATVYGYDARSRKTLDDHPGTADDVNYGYDAAGNLTRIANAASIWAYTWNKRGLLESEQASIDDKSYLLDQTYDGHGYLASLSTPGRNIQYGPTAFGQHSMVGGYARAIAYHPNGLPKSYTLGNDLRYTQTLDSRLRPQSHQTVYGEIVYQRFVYDYSPAGDLKSIDDTGDNTDDFIGRYDGLHRLIEANGLWGSHAYSYDPLNNLRARSLNGNADLSYSYSSGNRLTAISGSQGRSYSYNAKGEITGDGGKTFTLNNLGQISEIVGVASYVYDGKGRRIKSIKGSVTEITLYDHSGRLVYTENVNTAGPKKSTVTTRTDYLHLNNQAIAEAINVHTLTPPAKVPIALCEVTDLCTSTTVNSTRYLHTDLLGSPRKATDGNREIAWSEHFDPFGKKMNDVAEKIGYTGHAHDPESGYTYMQARFYDPLVGRFLSTDPIHFQDDNPFTFNRYAYANNNPYKYVDPLGTQVEMLPLDREKAQKEKESREAPTTGSLLGGNASSTSCSGNCGVPSAESQALDPIGLELTPTPALLGTAIVRTLGSLFKKSAAKGVDDLLGAAAGKTRSNGDILVDGGREKAKELFREFDSKGVGNRKIVSDKTGGGRGVEGALEDGTPLRIRMKPDGTTRIQAGDQKLIFPPN